MTTCISFPEPSKTLTPILCECGRSGSTEDLLGADAGDTVREREAQALGGELADVGALDVLGLLELNDAEDLVMVSTQTLGSFPIEREETYVDGSETRSVAGGHVGVHGLDSSAAGHLTVLLVHVVGAGARVVTDPDTEVLDLERVLLGDLVHGDDLTIGLLDLLELHQEVPETGLGNDLIGGKDAHAVELGGGVALGGQMAANDLVLLKTT